MTSEMPKVGDTTPAVLLSVGEAYPSIGVFALGITDTNIETDQIPSFNESTYIWMTPDALRAGKTVEVAECVRRIQTSWDSEAEYTLFVLRRLGYLDNMHSQLWSLMCQM